VSLARARDIANYARKTVAGGGTPLTPKVERADAEKVKRTGGAGRRNRAAAGPR